MIQRPDRDEGELQIGRRQIGQRSHEATRLDDVRGERSLAEEGIAQEVARQIAMESAHG